MQSTFLLSRTVLSKLAFPAREHRAIRVVLEALQHRQWPASEVMTASPGGDAQISSALLYLRLQPDLDPVLGSSLQRALCAAHECVLSDLAISEVSCDVNINANDVRKGDAYADARIKYEDYADFERYWGKKCSDDDNFSRENCDGNSATGGESARRGRENADDSLKVGNDDNEGRPSSSHSTGEGERQDLYEAFTKSCKVSADTGSNVGNEPDKKAADLSDGRHNRPRTAPADTNEEETKNLREGDGNNEQPYRERDPSSALDDSRFAPDRKLYVICYDASTSTQSDSVVPDADEAARATTNENAREAHHVTKMANENTIAAEKRTTDVATGTD